MNPTPPTPQIAQSIECTECAASISLQRQPLCGEIVRCRECQAELEVTCVSPLRIELAPEVEEDWGE
ncbi:MAG: lysine biosynthesis protein LysW [Phycisphaerales bacterium]|nr:lysine biosynthesis protein LysW [Phycisphaerales bacterium]